MESASLSFSDEGSGPKKSPPVRRAKFIDLVDDDEDVPRDAPPPKRAKSIEVPEPEERTAEAPASDDDNAFDMSRFHVPLSKQREQQQQQQHKQDSKPPQWRPESVTRAAPPPPPPASAAAPQAAEEDGGEIDLSKFFVPLSKQRLETNMFDFASEKKAAAAAAKGGGAATRKKPAAKAAKPKAAKKSAGREWGKGRGRGRGRGRGKARVEEEEEEEDEEEEEENDEEEAEVRTIKPKMTIASAFGATVVPAKHAHEFYEMLRMESCVNDNPGCTEEEVKSILGAMWESAHPTDKAPFVLLEQIDRKREAAERKLAAKK
jgi:hypothetical protein